MKQLFKMTVLFAALFLFSKTCFAKKNPVSETILIKHKWTLVEIIQKDNDTLTNLTLFLTTCEKDNFINYSADGTYQIFEGSDKCDNANSAIKGEGTWLFNSADSTILESYQGGKKIPKKLLILTDDILKIQYYGEGKKLFTLTYFSETGQKDEANKDLIIDNSDASQNITQIIKNYLTSTNQYVIATRKDFQNGTRSNEDDKKGLKPTVVVMPFTNDAKEVVNSTARNEQLIAQAKKSAIDYVITGRLISAESKLDNKNYVGSVKYELFVLDVPNGAEFAKTISDKDAPLAKAEKKKGAFWDKALKVGSVLAQAAPLLTNSYYGRYYYGGYYGHGYGYGYYYNRNYYSTYNTLFKVSRAASLANTTATVFTDVNETVRSDNYNKNNAAVEAVSKTTEHVIGFVADNTAPKIKINAIEGSGKKAEMVIEAGSNIGLEKGDRLSVVKVSGTGLSQRKKNIGEIEIKEVIQSGTSSCSIEGGKDVNDVIKAFKETPNEVVVVPQLRTAEK